MTSEQGRAVIEAAGRQAEADRIEAAIAAYRNSDGTWKEPSPPEPPLPTQEFGCDRCGVQWTYTPGRTRYGASATVTGTKEQRLCFIDAIGEMANIPHLTQCPVCGAEFGGEEEEPE